jgi:hypothetical protein
MRVRVHARHPSPLSCPISHQALRCEPVTSAPPLLWPAITYTHFTFWRLKNPPPPPAPLPPLPHQQRSSTHRKNGPANAQRILPGGRAALQQPPSRVTPCPAAHHAGGDRDWRSSRGEAAAADGAPQTIPGPGGCLQSCIWVHACTWRSIGPPWGQAAAGRRCSSASPPAGGGPLAGSRKPPTSCEGAWHAAGAAAPIDQRSVSSPSLSLSTTACNSSPARATRQTRHNR